MGAPTRLRGEGMKHVRRVTSFVRGRMSLVGAPLSYVGAQIGFHPPGDELRPGPHVVRPGRYELRPGPHELRRPAHIPSLVGPSCLMSAPLSFVDAGDRFKGRRTVYSGSLLRPEARKVRTGSVIPVGS
jgi:hypothetical protein